ncbi:MAG: hypothetical protein ACRD9R_01180 [Pyrinomonadaceae bacterium]
MSQNKREDSSSSSTPHTGGAGTGATDIGTTRDTRDHDTSLTTGGSSSIGGGLSTTGGSAATGTATARAGEGIGAQAQEYGKKVADAATQAKDYMGDKLTVVGDKLRDLQNKDFSQVAEEAKEYARQKPGQALLVSAAAGFLIGLLIKNSGRR